MKSTQYQIGDLDFLGKAGSDKIFSIMPAWVSHCISKFDGAFLAGLVLTEKPKKIIELGVASGLSTVIMLNALTEAKITDFSYYGVDIAERCFYDQNYATGQVIFELIPRPIVTPTLLLGKVAADVVNDIGAGIDFAFVDAHHGHPWVTLDVLTLLAFLKPNSWVALHDISLSLKSVDHANRGPKYLFDSWPDLKIYSAEAPSMIGAVWIGNSTEKYLTYLLDLLYTPWELCIEQHFLDSIIEIISANYGVTWAEKFGRAMELGNYIWNMTYRRSDNDVVEDLLCAE